jgi:site-specific DNA-methyltransferase (adenine-specific)
MDGWTIDLMLGDCLEMMGDIEDGSVDAVITDPPYAVTSEASSSVSRARRSVRETQFFEAWLRENLREFLRILRPEGVIWMTLDWRGAMALDEACAKLGLKEPKIGVWDKDSIGMGHVLRNSYECFAVVPMPAWKRRDGGCPDVWRHKWTQGGRASDHKAEKPVTLMERAISTFVVDDGIVLDPFMGSGTTGVATLNTGRRFIGIERDESYFTIAEARIMAAKKA